MYKIISIALGGACGALLRYFAGGLVHRLYAGPFPLGTMLINLSGSLVIGALWAAAEFFPVPQNARLFVFTGLLGAFTTFSTFSLESLHLARDGQGWLVFLNVALSVALGLLLVAAGYFCVRYALNVNR